MALTLAGTADRLPGTQRAGIHPMAAALRLGTVAAGIIPAMVVTSPGMAVILAASTRRRRVTAV